jgi:hypothetical protein
MTTNPLDTPSYKIMLEGDGETVAFVARVSASGRPP